MRERGWVRNEGVKVKEEKVERMQMLRSSLGADVAEDYAFALM